MRSFAQWGVKAYDHQCELPPPLPDLSPGEEVVEDYAALRLTLRRHPVAFLRTQLTEKGVMSSCGLTDVPVGTKVAVAGLSICRQRPGSAKGTVFITLEDETGVANLIVWPRTFQAFRKPILRASLIYAEGIVQKDGIVIHVLAGHCQTNWLGSTLLSPCFLGLGTKT